MAKGTSWPEVFYACFAAKMQHPRFVYASQGGVSGLKPSSNKGPPAAPTVPKFDINLGAMPKVPSIGFIVQGLCKSPGGTETQVPNGFVGYRWLYQKGIGLGSTRCPTLLDFKPQLPLLIKGIRGGGPQPQSGVLAL
jgi:hypothetical protein